MDTSGPKDRPGLLRGRAETSSSIKEKSPDPACRRCSAFRTLVHSLETQLDYYRCRHHAYNEAIETLSSEREANSILTQELANLETTSQHNFDTMSELTTLLDVPGLRGSVVERVARLLNQMGLRGALEHMDPMAIKFETPDEYKYEPIEAIAEPKSSPLSGDSKTLSD
jgi:hypothetical protein